MKHNVSHMPLKSELLLLSQKINFKEDYNEKHKNQCENRLGKQVFEFGFSFTKIQEITGEQGKGEALLYLISRTRIGNIWFLSPCR